MNEHAPERQHDDVDEKEGLYQAERGTSGDGTVPLFRASQDFDGPTLERLHDYVDGLLSDEETRAVERELDRDAAYRAELDEVRALLAEARGLREAIEPKRDLWSGIQQRLESKQRVTARHRRVMMAVAAAACIALFMVAGDIVRQPVPVDVPTATTNPDTPPLTAEFQLAVNEYREARVTLIGVLDKRRDTLSPQTAAVVDENLQIIAQAIGEIEAALAADPANDTLQHMLVATYQKEVDLLQQAAGISDAL